jgi:hypothetical protein
MLLRADSEAKQSIKEGTDSKLLLPVAMAQWKRKAKGASQFLSKHQTGQRKKLL